MTGPALAAALSLQVLLACGERGEATAPPPGDGGDSDGGDRDGGDRDGGDGDGGDGGSDALPAAQLDPVAWVARASLDLRGRRPSLEELAAATDEAAAAELVAGFADDPDLGLRLAWLYADRLRTAHYFSTTEIRQWDELGEAGRRAAGWAPLELVRHLVDEDLPLSGLVTSTTLPRNDTLAAAFDLLPTGTGEAWVLAPPDDDRPMAGLLSSSELWFVYDGDAFNRHRRRAHALARALVCDDVLEREVEFSLAIPVADLQAVESAIRTAPECTSCHATLDPLAAALGGFAERSFEYDKPRLYRYSPWSAEWAAAWTAPAWYGRPVGDLAELGAHVAVDPRFARCAARTVAEGLLGQPVAQALGGEEAAERWLDAHALGFAQEDGLVARALIRRLVLDPWYRAADERVLRPESMPQVLGALLGLDPEGEGLQPLAWSTEHRLLGGGLDDYTVLDRNPWPGVGHQVLLTWAARANAGPALEADAARAADARLLWTEVAPWAGEDAGRRAQLAAWHGRFLSAPVGEDAPELDRLEALWEAAGGAADPVAAWTTVVEALLRHPRALLY